MKPEAFKIYQWSSKNSLSDQHRFCLLQSNLQGITRMFGDWKKQGTLTSLYLELIYE